MKILDKIKELGTKIGIVSPDSDSASDPAAIDKWIQEMKKIERPCRELILEAGDPGPLPVTKIGGEPWWTKGKERPRCPEQGHPMVFMAQIRLSDIPGMEQRKDQLLSFHYCEQCSMDGNMCFGWDDKDHRGYEVKIFDNLLGLKHDHKGIIAEPHIASFQVTFAEKQEVPEAGDWPGELGKKWPHDFPRWRETFDENVYPGLVHVSRSKLGGWPTWVQDAIWPTCPEKQRMEFAGQIDWFLGDNTSWGMGGYAYLFVCPCSCKTPKGELVILTT